MSRRSALLQAGVAAAVIAVGTGCWEQWSWSWWDQMKWQIAVQAFELQGRPPDPERAIGNFMPPEGTVPVGRALLASQIPQAEGDQLPNPQPPTLASLENGKRRFQTFCSPCHGPGGLGDGPVAGPPYGKGPLLGVLPIAGPVGKAITGTFTDGHIFWVISSGIRRMPGYKRIPERDRWDIVNYVRYLNGVVVAPATAQTANAAPAAAASPAAAPAVAPPAAPAAPAAPGGTN